MQKYKCPNCGNWYDEGEKCKFCEKTIEEKSFDDKETERILKLLDNFSLYFKAFAIIIGFIVIIISNSVIRALVFLGFYIFFCFVFDLFLNWKRLMLSNLYEIKKNTKNMSK